MPRHQAIPKTPNKLSAFSGVSMTIQVESFRKLGLMAVGATALTAEKLQSLVEQMVKSGELDEQEAKVCVRVWANRLNQQTQQLEQTVRLAVNTAVKSAIDAIGLGTRQEESVMTTTKKKVAPKAAAKPAAKKPAAKKAAPKAAVKKVVAKKPAAKKPAAKPTSSKVVSITKKTAAKKPVAKKAAAKPVAKKPTKTVKAKAPAKAVASKTSQGTAKVVRKAK
jgi:polyhydroxyalkanoate synthesis regulator phasin